MNRRVVSILPLCAAVCLFLFAAATLTLAQKKVAANTKVAPNTQTATKNNVPTASAAKAKADTPATAAVKTNNATNLSFMSPQEKEILDEMNLARADPQKYAGFVEEFKKYYDGNRLIIPGRKKAIVTNEGLAAVDEAVNFLRNQKTVPALDIAKGLWLAAKDHASDLAAKGLSGHLGSDGSLPNARVDRYGNWEGAIGETVLYDLNPARQIVIALIIDDGTPNRGHRRNIFDPNYKVAGVSIAESPTNGARCVVDYVGGFKEKTGSASNR